MARRAPGFQGRFVTIPDVSALLLALTLCAAAATLEHGGLTRTYELVAPPGAAGPRPAVFALHGGGGTARQLREHVGARLEPRAAEAGFLVVYPDGVEKGWNDGRGDNVPAANRNVDDLGFLAALADRLVAEGKADPRRLHLVGISNGGFMSHALACAQAGRWASAAVLVASLGEAVAASCRPARAVPMLMVNGTEDRLVPWDGREVRFLGRRRGRKLTVPETVRKWAELDGCRGEPLRSDLPDPVDDGVRWSLEARRDCRDGAEVLLYKMAGGGHTWPNGKPYLPRLVGRTSRDVDFEALALGFFGRHALPEAR